MNDGAARRDAGFTLLEVLVALAILSVSLSVLLGMLSSGLFLAQGSSAETTNLVFARSLIDRLGVDLPIRDGEVSGVADDGTPWQVHVEPFGSAADREAWPLQARMVVVTVASGGDAAATLTTLRLVPKARSP